MAVSCLGRSLVRSILAKLAMGGLVSTGLVSAASANGVQVALEGQQLRIEGDDAGNAITIRQLASGEVIVTGRNGTLINGQLSVRFRGAVLETVEMRMEGGNDDVLVNGLSISNDLFANLGEGNDRFRSTGAPTQIQNNLSIEGGAGNEVITIADWSIASDVTIDGQVGTLNATLTRVAADFGITVIGDDARDTVRLTDCTAGDFVGLDTKKGDDLVRVVGLTSLGLVVAVDDGADKVYLTDVVTTDDVSINSGKQNDVVEMTDVFSGKNILVSMDEGNDVLDGVNVFAQFDAVFEGGAGVDTYIDGGIAGGEKTEVKEFELFQ